MVAGCGLCGSETEHAPRVSLSLCTAVCPRRWRVGYAESDADAARRPVVAVFRQPGHLLSALDVI
eukprot:1035016-Rhodomonas_salina.1